MPINVIPGNLVYMARMHTSREPVVTVQFKNCLDKEILRSSIGRDLVH
jgi:hypothetical protein